MTGEKLLALKAKADPARGEIAFEVCQGCHRRDASGRVSGAFPRLAGQHASVLIKQMTDIRSGKRENPKMDPFVGGHVVTPQEIADIAAYLQGLPIPTNNGKGTGDNLARGKELFAKDCASCHGDHGEGVSEKFYPMVAAQHYKYLLREIRMIRDGERHNANPDMVKVVKPYSDGDMDAVADFMSRMEPPKK
ncbi:c-type cytochrome [Herbaspirillum sp. HC18]|nr:c-type cytochrome [Herbaspirillum sp. HC18]